MYDARDPQASHPPIEPLRPPKGAPNILLVLLDDVGFGATSVFGGACRTPVLERLAASGLRFTRFHTTAICSATRQALLTGRNHHSVGMGTVSDMATSAPGYTSRRPNTAATIAGTLRLNGYSTAQLGKCHEAPMWEWSPMGPFDRWPTGNGFEYFYGFIGGETNQFHPSLIEGTSPVRPSRTPEEGYHLTEDLAQHACRWLSQQRGLMPDKPLFLYFAPGATHAPLHVPADWRDRYRSEFDRGWDVVREETFARQKQLGIVPPNSDLTARPDGIPAWHAVPDEMKPVLTRGMELYAAFLEHTDHCIGQVVDFYGVELYHIEAGKPLPVGKHLVRMQFDYDGGGAAKGGTVRLFVDDRPVGQGRVERTQPLPFASDEPFEIGSDCGSPVTPDYSAHTFTGNVNWVEIEIPEGGIDCDSEVAEEARLQVALARE